MHQIIFWVVLILKEDPRFSANYIESAAISFEINLFVLTRLIMILTLSRLQKSSNNNDDNGYDDNEDEDDSDADDNHDHVII